MKNLFSFVMLISLLLGVIGCGDKSSQVSPGTTDASTSQRPAWVMNEPELEGGDMYFVGLSALHATEKNARNDARRDAVNVVVQYLGTLAKTKFEQAAVSYGLGSQVVDPTTSSREYQKLVAANVVRRMKITKWYMERDTDSIGQRGYKYWALAKIPKASINGSFQQTAKKNMEDAQRRAKEAATAQAKEQAENASKFWEDMQKQGVVE